MNCRRAERALLLMDSGELPPRKMSGLEQHLAQCHGCRVRRDDFKRLAAAARLSLPTGAPADRTMAAILAAACAAAARPAKTQSLRWAALWRPALAAAALLLLCLGGWWLADRGPAASRAPAAGGASVAWEQPAVIPLVPSGAAGDAFAALLAEDVVTMERLSDLAFQSELSPLDRDLLLLEGLAI